MLKELWDGLQLVRQLLGGLVVLGITVHAFEAVIQPALVHICPVFADQGVYWTGRYPNTPAQAARFVTACVGIYVYYTLIVLLNEGIDEFIERWKPFFDILVGLSYLLYGAIYFIVVAFPQIIYHHLKKLIFWK